jgi:hypothetical protein
MKLTSKLSRIALAATCAAGLSGLVAGPAAAANNYVTQPVVTGVSSLTPESAVLSGAIDTGGDPAVTFAAAPADPYSFGGLTITAPSILNGIPLNLGFYSTAQFEADPLSDYVASGDQPGPDTVTAATVEVPTTTGLSAVSGEVGAYPAATSTGSSPLHPGTTYVYLVVQQVGETDAATTVNEYNASDLANWIAGSGTITAQGFASSSSVSSSSDEAAWTAGTGKYAGDPDDPTTIPGSIVNPDYACVLNTTIAANTNAGWQAELLAGKDPVSAGTSAIAGTALPFGVASATATGSFNATSAQEPAEQGPCVAFYGGNSTNFYTSAIGYFKTPALGKIVFGSKATVSGKKATLTVTDKSVESAAGTITLTIKKGRKAVTVASGKFSVPAGATGSAKLKLTDKGVSALAAVSSLATKVTLVSTTDQPTSSRKVTLKG